MKSRVILAIVAAALVAAPLAEAQTSRPAVSQRKEDVNRRNPDGSTPLQWAVYAGDVAEAKRLLRAGANASLANNYGATPMSLASSPGRPMSCTPVGNPRDKPVGTAVTGSPSAL